MNVARLLRYRFSNNIKVFDNIFTSRGFYDGVSNRRMKRYMDKASKVISGENIKKKKNSIENQLRTLAVDLQHNSTNENFTSVINASLVNAEHEKPKKPPKYSNPRLKQLNSVLFNYIEPLAFELCPVLIKMNFEITQVALTSQFDSLLIFWSATVKDDEILGHLSKLTTDLRSELTGLRVISRIPPVIFCKDLKVDKVEEVERLLSIAEMGSDEDHRVADTNHEDSNLKSASEESVDDFDDVFCSKNKKDLYGIDHDLLKSEIVMMKKKAKKNKPLEIAKE